MLLITLVTGAIEVCNRLFVLAHVGATKRSRGIRHLYDDQLDGRLGFPES